MQLKYRPILKIVLLKIKMNSRLALGRTFLPCRKKITHSTIIELGMQGLLFTQLSFKVLCQLMFRSTENSIKNCVILSLDGLPIDSIRPQ